MRNFDLELAATPTFGEGRNAIDAHTRASNQGMPYSMVRGYGDKAFPFLERAVAISPYVWVRTQSAKELALNNRPIGFQFLLDAIEANQPYKVEMIRWIKDNFPSEVPYGANERQIALFLRKHLGP